jgi:hypothetical protein
MPTTDPFLVSFLGFIFLHYLQPPLSDKEIRRSRKQNKNSIFLLRLQSIITGLQRMRLIQMIAQQQDKERRVRTEE